ncbi:MAG: EAL domain-containing protein [Pseudomonadota bacterium]
MLVLRDLRREREDVTAARSSVSQLFLLHTKVREMAIRPIPDDAALGEERRRELAAQSNRLLAAQALLAERLAILGPTAAPPPLPQQQDLARALRDALAESRTGAPARVEPFDALDDALHAIDDDLAETVRLVGRAKLLAAILPQLLAAAIALTLAALVLSPRRRAAEESAEEDPRAEEQHDPVTGLPNRAMMDAHLRACLAGPEAQRARMAILHIDIDDFQSVNDAHGYAAGDRLLRLVGDRIGGVLRSSDFVARIGDDDFLVALDTGHLPGGADRIVRRIQAEIRQPARLEDGAFRPSCSIGVVEGELLSADADACVANAKTALTIAKQIGAGLVQYYSREIRTEKESRNRVARDLARSLDHGLIQPYFQPQVDLATGAVVGLEALARWLHPSRGVLSPGAFLEIAEQTGRGHLIADAMLEQSLETLESLDAAGLDVPRVALNFTSDQLADPRLPDRLKWALDPRGLAPGRVAVEVLETVLIEHDEEAVARTIRTLAEAGFAIELDDFGTGHAAIANIRRFAVSRIKIDRSFVAGLDRDPQQASYVAAMVNMARSLGVEALAEGVETVGERERLVALGCQFAQGFLFARPMPAAELPEWLRTWRAARPALRAEGA